MYIDTHAHLDFAKFQSDFDDVVRRAREKGVVKMVNVGYDAESSRRNVVLAKKYDDMYAACGIHPSDISSLSLRVLDEFRDLVSSCDKVVAIGEIGLDYFRGKEHAEAQKKGFRCQLALASELSKPVIIHCRDSGNEDKDAYVDVLNILDEGKNEKAVFHCFSADLVTAEKIWKRGFLTSFTGNITYRGAEKIREVVSAVPSDLFMLETDCPFLSPQSHRGQRNEPSYLPEIAIEFSKIRSVSVDEIVLNAYQNSEKFFGW